MKYLMFLTTVFLAFGCALPANQSAYPYEVFSKCNESISKIEDGKAYLILEKLYFHQNQFYIQNDTSQWICLEKIFWDEKGCYVDSWDPECPNGHVGIYRVKGTWYCNEDGCPYFIGENFAH